MIKELSTLAETATDGLKTYNLKERDYLRNITLLTYLITPWNRVLLEKLTGSQLVKKFPTSCGTATRVNTVTSHKPVLNAEDIVTVLRVLNPVTHQPNVPCVEGHTRRTIKAANNIMPP